MSYFIKQSNGLRSLALTRNQSPYVDACINFNNDNNISSIDNQYFMYLPIEFELEDEEEIYKHLELILNNEKSDYKVKFEYVKILTEILKYLLREDLMTTMYQHLDVADLLNYEINEHIIDILYTKHLWTLLTNDVKITPFDDNELLPLSELKGPEKIISTLNTLTDNFKVLLSEYSNHVIKEDFVWTNIYCAGGVIATLFGVNERLPNSDIDLWILNDNIDVVVRTLKYLFVPNETLIITRKNVISVIRGNVNIQLICVRCDSIDEIVLEFDLPYVQCYYSDNQLYLTGDCLNTWITKTISNYQFQHNSHSRIYKSLQKGYKFDDDFVYYNLDVNKKNLLTYLSNHPMANKYDDKFYHLTKKTNQLSKDELLEIAKRFLTDVNNILFDDNLNFEFCFDKIKFAEGTNFNEIYYGKTLDKKEQLCNVYNPIGQFKDLMVLNDKNSKFNIRNIPPLSFRSINNSKFVGLFEVSGTVVFNDLNCIHMQEFASNIHITLDEIDNQNTIEHFKAIGLYDFIFKRKFSNHYKNAINIGVIKNEYNKSLILRLKNEIKHKNKYTFLLSIIDIREHQLPITFGCYLIDFF